MGKKNNVAAINHVTLQQIKSDSKNTSLTKLAKKYGIGYAAAKNAVAAKNLTDFKQRMTEYNTQQALASNARRAEKKQNDKAKAEAAEKIKASANTYTDKQVKGIIDGLVVHVDNLEERIQTLTSLLITSEDNLVTRVYNLEGKRSAVRRFLDKF